MHLRTAAMTLAAGFLIFVAGCADRSYVYNASVTSGYSPTQYNFAAGGRDLETVIEGNPFDIEKERFDEAVTTALNRFPPVIQPTNFTTTPGENAREGYRAVFRFDVPVAVNSLAMCDRPRDVPVVDTGDTLRVAGAFCRGGRTLSAATGQLDGVEGIDDPRFEALLARVVDALFPLLDPTRDDDGDGFLIIDAGAQD